MKSELETTKKLFEVMYDYSTGSTAPAAESNLKGRLGGSGDDKRVEDWITSSPMSRYRRLGYVEQFFDKGHPYYRLTADGVRFLVKEIPTVLAISTYWETRF